jgi:leader peptidase (prepilin peptidase)/N-methyltransferase
MTAYVATLAGVLGLAVGSFLNVVIHRVPRGESVVSPPSACPSCGHAIRNRHNVPVLGWLVLRGRCFDCGHPISPRYPLVELGTGLLFVAVAIRFHHDLPLLPAYLTFAALGIALTGIDLDVRRLPNSIVLPAYPVLAALLAIDAIRDGDAHRALRAVEGGVGLLAFFFVIAFAAPGAMGFGDVKLSGVIGAMTAYLSWGTLLVAAFGAFFFGAVLGVALILVSSAGRKTAVPFGPFLVLGAWTAILGAGHLGEAYLNALR